MNFLLHIIKLMNLKCIMYSKPLHPIQHLYSGFINEHHSPVYSFHAYSKPDGETLALSLLYLFNKTSMNDDHS